MRLLPETGRVRKAAGCELQVRRTFRRASTERGPALRPLHAVDALQLQRLQSSERAAQRQCQMSLSLPCLRMSASSLQRTGADALALCRFAGRLQDMTGESNTCSCAQAVMEGCLRVGAGDANVHAAVHAAVVSACIYPHAPSFAKLFAYKGT